MKRVVVFLMVFFLAIGTMAQPIRFACVGNSITSGAGDPKTNPDTYPAQLRILMGAEYDIQNFGVSGRTLLRKGDYPLWDEEAFSEALAFNPNIVTIMLGTNDSKPYNWVYKDEFVTDFTAMIDTFRSLAANPDIYLCIPPPAFSIQWDIDDSIITADIIPRIQQVATEKGTPLIDFRTPFVDKNYLFPDDIHPSIEGYWEFAKIFYNFFTDSMVLKLDDVNLALNKTVLSSSSIMPPGNLVDGDRSSAWVCNEAESVTIDLESVQSMNMFQVFFQEESVYQYRIETSPDNSTWNMAVDKMANPESSCFTFDEITATDARYVRLTVRRSENTGHYIPIFEFKILATAPIHAPILSYAINKVLASSIRFDIIAQSTQRGGFLKYLYNTNSTDPICTAGAGYRSDSLLTTRASIPIDGERHYLAVYYRDGFEAVSDTLQLDYSLTSVTENTAELPTRFSLNQNYPNPFNAETMISFDISQKSRVQLVLINIHGQYVRQLVNQEFQPGKYQVALNADDLTSGIYFIQMKAGQTISTRKIALLK